VIELAVGYLSAYLARKSLVLLGRAGEDVDGYVDQKLGELYDWVKGRLTGAPTSELSLGLLEETPDGARQQALVGEQLSAVVEADGEAAIQLQAIVEELERRRPAGVSIRGFAGADDVHGEQIGVEAEGPLAPGTEVSGEARAQTVHPGGRNIGTRTTGS
jgi:uncharacterized protein YdbL (DUF1318 family)